MRLPAGMLPRPPRPQHLSQSLGPRLKQLSKPDNAHDSPRRGPARTAQTKKGHSGFAHARKARRDEPPHGGATGGDEQAQGHAPSRMHTPAARWAAGV